MNSGFVVVPYPDHRDLLLVRQLDADCVILALSKRRQPGMEIVIGKVVAIDELINRSGIRSISHEEIDVTGVGLDVSLSVNLNGTSFGIKYLDASQT